MLTSPSPVIVQRKILRQARKLLAGLLLAVPPHPRKQSSLRTELTTAIAVQYEHWRERRKYSLHCDVLTLPKTIKFHGAHFLSREDQLKTTRKDFFVRICFVSCYVCSNRRPFHGAERRKKIFAFQTKIGTKSRRINLSQSREDNTNLSLKTLGVGITHLDCASGSDIITTLYGHSMVLLTVAATTFAGSEAVYLLRQSPGPMRTSLALAPASPSDKVRRRSNTKAGASQAPTS